MTGADYMPRTDFDSVAERRHWPLVMLPTEDLQVSEKELVAEVVRKLCVAGVLRDLTAEEKTRFAGYNYIKFEAYPASEHPIVGQFWTQRMLDETELVIVGNTFHKRSH